MGKSNKLKNVENNVNIPEMEGKIIDFWNKNSILDKYLNRNKKADKNFSFIDGPMTANNSMRMHHAWGRTYKDIVQRYKNMQGYEQRFQNGFDCQGLWVEVEVEKELGFNNKKDILDYGLDKFIEKCVARVNKYSGVQTEQSKRLGMFMDWDNSYYTMSKENNLYIWYFLKKCWEKGLIYENKSATTWCPRCETGLSQHEQADCYKDIVDKSVFVFFKLKDSKEEYMLAWTTTPWTLSSNVLLAVNPELQYVKTNIDGKTVYLGADAAKRLNIKDTEEINIKDLIGREYESLFDVPAQKGIKHSIVEWDQVDSQSGAGVVHIAPGCGAEDFELGKKLGADIISPLDQSGHFVEGFGSLDGKYAHDVADEVIQQLKDMGMLYKEEEYKHSYPHCWRCKTKCLFRLENNWYLNVRAIKEDLIKATETVTWKPDFAKKRMLAWLNNMEDWMISRKRFYGLALPFYVCPKCGHLHVVGGLEELKELAVNPEQVDKLESVHRPWIDEIEIKCPECGANVKRITDVGDCWLDAGVVPFSTLHYLDDKKYWEKWYPAEFVTEMIEQVRLWFYAILVFGVVLEDRAPYSTVLCSAELRDEHNQKMSKTGNNSIDFYDAADKVGSDLVRWTYSTASVGANMRFGWSIIEDVRRRFYIPLWNSYNYFVTYSILHNFDLSTYDVTKLTNVMDKWIVAKTKQLGIHIASYLDNYDMASSAREAEEYVKDLSQWYIRRSRNRFKNGDTDALGTLHFCLLSISKILAPFMPFVTEEMYQNLAVNMDTENHKESVHLEDYPTYTLDKEETDLLDNMTTIRNICSNGLKARENAKMSLRQPLSIAYVGTKDTISQDIIREELNVEKIEYAEKPVEGDGIYTVGEKEMFVSIDANLTEELKNAGIISTFLRKYKDLRKKKGLKMGDIVSLNIHTETEELKDVLQNYSESNTEELQAKDVTIDTDLDKGGEEIDVCGNKIKVEIY